MRILLVEDFPELRTATQEILEVLGHEVLAVATGWQALTALGGSDAGFDLLITDLELPGLSGTELLLRLLARDTRLALLAYSSSPGDDTLADLVARGRVVFLPKPCSFELLARRLADAALARDFSLPVA